MMGAGRQIIKMRNGFGIQREIHTVGVHRQKTEAMPSSKRELGGKKLDAMLVEFRKSMITQFSPCLGERRFGDNPYRNGSLLQELKKRIQFGLDGRFQKVGQIENQSWKV